MTERSAPSHLVKFERDPIEDVLVRNLAHVDPERFRAYRKAYFRTLNADADGFVPDYPLTLTIELVNRCNLTCVMCYTVNHKTAKATLTLDQLQTVFDDAKLHGLPAVIIGIGSEGLLYKDIRKVILMAKNTGVMDIFLFTNGVLLNEALSEFLIEQKVSRILISLDAATPETYKKIRGKDELLRIEKNVRSLLAAKQRRGSELPIVRLSFCVQKDNEHEQATFLEKWSAEVDYLDFQVLSDFGYVSEILETGSVKDPARPVASEGDKFFCHHPFGYLNIWSNGDITPCCVYYGKKLVMGNIARDKLSDVWKGEGMAELRRQFMTGNVNETCRVCLSQRENHISDSMKSFVEAASDTAQKVKANT